MELTTEQEQTVRQHLESIKSELNASLNIGSILDKFLAFVAYLQDSEKLLIIAIEKSQNVPPSYTAPKSGRAEFGWLPYLFKHASESGSSDPLVKALQTALNEVFGKYAATLEKILTILKLLPITSLSPLVPARKTCHISRWITIGSGMPDLP